MRKLANFVSGSTVAVGLALSASNARAHIELVEPAPRYALPANKSCPCGDGDSNRVCQDTAEESSDPNRSSSVTTFEAGSTITVVAEEYIDHAGRMRVAFDPDGADLADFNANILHDEADPGEAGLSMANPHVWEFEIELPSEPCERCTLQVVQVMNVDTEVEVEDPAPFSTYYTCADIRLVEPGTLGASAGDGDDDGDGDEPEASAGSGGLGAGGAAGSAMAMGGAGAGGGGPAAVAAAGTGAVSDAGGDDTDEGGCALRAGRGSATWALGLAPFALLGLRRLRRRLTSRCA